MAKNKVKKTSVKKDISRAKKKIKTDISKAKNNLKKEIEETAKAELASFMSRFRQYKAKLKMSTAQWFIDGALSSLSTIADTKSEIVVRLTRLSKQANDLIAKAKSELEAQQNKLKK